MQKCTEGIWIWSQPFVEERPNADGEMEKVAVLLMDTQGAWDSCLSKEDSATIFGLTSVLSSRQVYNISKQIQEDKATLFLSFHQLCLSNATLFLPRTVYSMWQGDVLPQEQSKVIH